MELATHWLLARALQAAHALHVAWAAAIGWRWTPVVAVVAVSASALVFLTLEHRRWQKGWLSGLIAPRVSAAHKRSSPEKKRGSIGWRSRVAAVRLGVIEHWDGMLVYFRNKFVEDLRAPDFPSLASFLIIATIIAAFFVVPHPPSIELGSALSDWWRWLTVDLQSNDGKTDSLIIGAFSGLVVVVIALIVFVAESIRDDNDYERKRVLIRISWLWPLSSGCHPDTFRISMVGRARLHCVVGGHRRGDHAFRVRACHSLTARPGHARPRSTCYVTEQGPAHDFRICARADW